MPRPRHLALAVLLVGALAGGAALLLTRTATDARDPAVARADADVPADVDAPSETAPSEATPSEAAPGKATPTGALRALLGEVVNDKGEPIVGATVRAQLVDGDVEARTTDGDGAFSLDALRADVATLGFSAPGYAPVDVPGARLPRMSEAFWSQKLARSDERLLGIGGTVVDAGGQPVTSYRVIIAPQGGDPAARRRGTRMDAIEDAAGAFLRADVDEPVQVQAIARGFRPSAQVDASPGDRVRIVLEKSNALRGRVTDAATNAPIAGARVALDGMRTLDGAVTDDEGRYAIETLPGERVSVNVRADGYLPLTMGGVEGNRSRDEVLDAKLTRITNGVATEVVGIGVGVGRHADGVLVRSVFEGPAKGILDDGDVITEVDGVSMRGRPLRDGMAAIRGEAGTSIRLVVRKASGAEERITLDRARVSVPEG